MIWMHAAGLPATAIWTKLHAKIRPFMLRHRKTDVETELPERTVRTFFVPLSREQKDRYEEHYAQVARLASIAKRRPLTQEESEKLLRLLAMMRMVCDTNYILDRNEKACPKLRELEKILEECRENSDVKVLVFAEWERMLELVQELCKRLGIGYALHTGSVPQRRRRAEILLFKNDPDCRVFLSTDSGSTGLNLQKPREALVVRRNLFMLRGPQHERHSQVLGRSSSEVEGRAAIFFLTSAEFGEFLTKNFFTPRPPRCNFRVLLHRKA